MLESTNCKAQALRKYWGGWFFRLFGFLVFNLVFSEKTCKILQQAQRKIQLSDMGVGHQGC
jgi:hypothetical protein